MNIIHKLFDEEFVIAFFKKRVLPHYPEFVGIKSIETKAHKDHIWDETYHVVLEFKTVFVNRDGKTKKLPIFCAAHSEEPRKNLYKAQKYLWDNGFSKGYLRSPRPLFYSNKFRAAFYRGAEGRNFYQYIRENNRDEIKNLLPKIASWFYKLHLLPTEGAINFNKENSRIETAIPGKNEIISLLSYRYPHYKHIFEKFYEVFIKQEKEFLKSTDKRWLIHGDAHPENVIKVGSKKISMIDFNDMCLSDFARDLGCFLQQFEYMAMRKIGDREFIDQMKDLFLDSYLKEAKIKIDKDLQSRIDNYYNWTMARTAIFILLKNNPEPEKAEDLVKRLSQNISLL